MGSRIIRLFFILFSYGSLSAQMPEVVFMPHWLPQAQFAGYYVAQAKGFYEEAGIKVKIVHPSASIMPTESLLSGKVDVISLFLVTAMTTVGNGAEIVNIAQMSQNSALLFVTKKSKNIKTIQELNGKKIGIWKSGFDEIPKSLVNSLNLKVTWVPILSSINMFMLDGVDAMTVMWYNEYDQIINAGYNPEELNTFFFSRQGCNMPEDGLYCLKNTYNTRKQDLRKFAEASLKGWEYAENHPEEAIEIVLEVMKKNHIPTNYAHQQWMLEKVLQLMKPPSEKGNKGYLSKITYEKDANKLLSNGFLKSIVPYSEFFMPVLSFKINDQ